MKLGTDIDLDAIADNEAKTTVEAISVANEMRLINDQQDLQSIIKAGITGALEALLLKIDITQEK